MSTADLSIATPSPPIDTTGLLSLRQGIIQTSIHPLVARWMIQLFLAAIAALPLLQVGEDLLRSRPIQALEIVRPTAHALVLLSHGHLRDAVHQIQWSLSKPFLSNFEDQLNESASAKRLTQPYLQYLLTDWLSFGNSIALIARDGWQPNGWLFYQVSLDYLAGPGLLDPHSLHLRQQQFLDDGDPHPNADPRPAIIRFSEDCRRAGAHLIFVPIPVKPMLHPAQLSPNIFAFPTSASRRPEGSSRTLPSAIPTPNNPSYSQFLVDLRAAGVDVFDPTPPTLTPDDQPYFLTQDTHWTPQWMEQVAQDLADHIRHDIPLPPPSSPSPFGAAPLGAAPLRRVPLAACCQCSSSPSPGTPGEGQGEGSTPIAVCHRVACNPCPSFPSSLFPHFVPSCLEVAPLRALRLRLFVPRYEIAPQLISRVGDIVDALHLPPRQGLYDPQPVLIHRVLNAATHAPAQSNPHADVLLIGDSFSNIYSAPQMGWGDAAGFPHQLMRFLNRDIEILARNGSAASDLRAELASRPHPLRGKRLVIWQVSMHELTASNWAIIPIPPDPPPSPQLAFGNCQFSIVNQAPFVSFAVPYPHKEQMTKDKGQWTTDFSADHP